MGTSTTTRVRWVIIALGLAVIIIFFSESETYAETAKNLPAQNSNSRSFLRNLRDDFVYIFQEKDFYGTVGGLTAAPFVLKSQFEQESPEFTEMWGSSPFADNFFEGGEFLGSAVYPVAASTVIYALSVGRQNSSLKSFGSDLLRAQIFNGLITISMKGIINRSRPDGAPYGYPSGHTTTAFTTAGVIYHHLGPRFGIPAFIAASYVGLSRLQENKHYVTDIIAGGIIGTYISSKIVNRKNNTGFGIRPAVFDGSPGANFSWRF